MEDYIGLIDRNGKKVKSKLRPVGFNRRAAEIFRRRNEIRASGVSSMEMVHTITKLVDPDLTRTIERSMWNLFEEEMTNNYHQKEIGEAIYQCC